MDYSIVAERNDSVVDKLLDVIVKLLQRCRGLVWTSAAH